jgi:pilus assembly protein FimV
MEAPATADGGSTRAFAEEEFDTDVALADEDEFDFQDEGDSANTKLDLARAYIDMGDADGARDILKEVVDEGNSEQQQQAQAMLESL